MTQVDRHLMAVASEQAGAFTRTQAYEAGVSEDELQSRVRSGVLLRCGPKTFRVAGVSVDLRTQLHHLMLDIGEPAYVSAETAAALYGFQGFRLALPFHVLVPRARYFERPGVVTHRTTAIPLADQAMFAELPITTAARTLIDLSRRHSADVLTTALDSALAEGLVSETHLHRRIVSLRSQGRYGLPELMEVVGASEAHRGVESWLEREFLRLLDGAGLAKPETQAVLSRAGNKMVRVDCRFPGTSVVVELLGYRWHRTQSQMSSDARRMNALISDGFRPYQFTYRQVVNESDDVVATVAQALHT